MSLIIRRNEYIVSKLYSYRVATLTMIFKVHYKAAIIINAWPWTSTGCRLRQSGVYNLGKKWHKIG